METNNDKVEGVKARLAQRNSERILELQRKKEKQAESINERESVTYFTEKFKEEIKGINDKLEDSSNVESKSLPDHFDGIAKRVQMLQKFVSDSSMFLPSYDIRSSQSQITELQARIDDKRDVFLPKKKFSFRTQKKQIAQQKEAPKEHEKQEVISITEKKAEDFCGFKDITGETLTLEGHSITQKDITLSNLHNCNITIFGSPAVMHIKSLIGCKVKCGPTSRAVFVDDCQKCSFNLACQQLRIHTTTDSTFKIHVTSKAIIEDCNALGFGIYDFTYVKLDEDYQVSGLSRDVNNWALVDDFNWLKLDEKSPHWYVISNIE